MRLLSVARRAKLLNAWFAPYSLAARCNSGTGDARPRKLIAWFGNTISSSNITVVPIDSVDGIVLYADQPARANPVVVCLVQLEFWQMFSSYIHPLIKAP